MPLPVSLQPEAQQTLCCTCWPSPTKRSSLFPSTISIVSVRACRSLPISNLEEDLSQPISTQQAALLSSQSACLKLDCSAETLSPLPDARSLKKQPRLKRRRRKKSSASSTRRSSRPADSLSSKEISLRKAAS